jgi:formylglycine-generating enzyme required for sulfatase activity/tRNA A-37 threonylcarbamoyl transferase component Bud32/dienelactone hydrolase
VSTISHYRLEGEIGRGGMGVVYRAVDTRLGRPVAIKVLPPEAIAEREQAESGTRRRRFIQEARAASALNHPNIVTIYEVDEHEGTTFIAMELVDGTALDRLLASGPLPIATALEYGVQIAAALDAAHAAGIIHRDIKPANIVITRDGRAKVLDFGVAKLAARPADATVSALGTTPGLVVGTAAYMSPEQAQGAAVDARSDLFSFGAVLYEMLSGRRPFVADSDVGLLTTILRDAPPPLRSRRPEIPGDVEAAVERALAKDPGERFLNASAMREALAAAYARLTRPPEAAWRRPRVLVPVAALLLALAAFGIWQTVQARRARWARLEALPQIERLYLSGRTMEAVRLAREAERYAPEDVARTRAGWVPFRLVTEPDGAQLEIRNYHDLDGAWEPFGVSPLQTTLPFGYYRVRISKAGYKTLEVSAGVGRQPVKLTPESETTPGMVFVPGGPYQVGVAAPVTLPDFWIDQLETTNAEFKRFVDAGGYREPKYWKAPFRDGGRVLTFDEAMTRFRDTTGRPAPATWELGSYLEGRGDHPVAGLSWFEAAAYAEFAGKSLPTLYHWFYAAGKDENYSDILQLSNFDGKGPTKAGERSGLGPWGTFDMAGNVKEWCVNEVGGAELRYILGGGWNEPSYRFAEQDAHNPWTRHETHGVRLVKDLGPVGRAAAPVARVTPDPSTIVPVSDELFAIYRRFYEYDRTPLEARVEAVDDSSPYWRKEKVSFAAAYGSERMPAYLFLPKNATPPYQTVVLFPSAYGLAVPSSNTLDLGTFEFIIRSGRALLYPVYKGTFERRTTGPLGPSAIRDLGIQMAKDLFRAVDYLETRGEVDAQKLAYYSLSMGAFFGPIPVSLEPRIKVAVFASGGLRYNRPPETTPSNFMPRVKVPVLLVNGKDDFGVPLADQRRFFELLGTPEPHKKHVVLEGGHVPQDIRGLFREVLNWLDLYLGPVT